MSNNIFYDPYNEIRCDRFALEKLVNESEAKDQRIEELEEQLKNATKQVRKKVCEEIRSRFLATCQIEKGCDTASFSLEVLNRILDQIQESQGEKK